MASRFKENLPSEINVFFVEVISFVQNPGKREVSRSQAIHSINLFMPLTPQYETQLVFKIVNLFFNPTIYLLNNFLVHNIISIFLIEVG